MLLPLLPRLLLLLLSMQRLPASALTAEEITLITLAWKRLFFICKVETFEEGHLDTWICTISRSDLILTNKIFKFEILLIILQRKQR